MQFGFLKVLGALLAVQGCSIRPDATVFAVLRRSLPVESAKAAKPIVILAARRVGFMTVMI